MDTQHHAVCDFGGGAPAIHADGVTYVVLSGLPGAGKSQIAAPLARALGLGIFAKDPVKETLWDSLRGANDLEWSRLLGQAANEVVVSVAAANAGGVLDSFWRHEWAADALGNLPGPVIEVFCACPLEEARRRYTDRVRHAAHMDAPRADDPDLWGDLRNSPLFEDALVVDTTAAVDVPALAVSIRADRRWEAPPELDRPILVVMTGLPGTGKSAVAAALSAATGAVVVAHDITEAALLRTGLERGGGPVAPAYDIIHTLAREQLRSGKSVILDSVVGRSRFRDAQLAIANDLGVPLVVIECVCSDEALHRERLETRRRDIPGWYEPDWAEVERIASFFEPWNIDHLVLDAVDPLADNVGRAVGAVYAVT